MSDFGFYFNLGWHHIIAADALDHQLFVLALTCIFLLQEIRRVLVMVTAFTLGHSLTLALSVYDIIRFPARSVEFFIPCTIFITAAANIYYLDQARQKGAWVNYFLALGFGLIHGMGFANAIRIMLAKDQKIGCGLFGFNCGLEAGQVVVVAVSLLLGWIALNMLKVHRRDWIFFISAGIFSLALKMAFDNWPVR